VIRVIIARSWELRVGVDETEKEKADEEKREETGICMQTYGPFVLCVYTLASKSPLNNSLVDRSGGPIPPVRGKNRETVGN